jgi:hypothetical protein
MRSLPKGDMRLPTYNSDSRFLEAMQARDPGNNLVDWKGAAKPGL